jgi:hypothetical protein
MPSRRRCIRMSLIKYDMMIGLASLVLLVGIAF